VRSKNMYLVCIELHYTWQDIKLLPLHNASMRSTTLILITKYVMRQCTASLSSSPPAIRRMIPLKWDNQYRLRNRHLFHALEHTLRRSLLLTRPQCQSFSFHAHSTYPLTHYSLWEGWRYGVLPWTVGWVAPVVPYKMRYHADELNRT
jgi:hypothetical protein